MEVQLYVYDLTHGMARAMSRQYLGIQIDAVYHTSLVFDNVEYFFGMGIQTCYPGTTHHGRPMEIVPMGVTHLPLETILDYLESLKEIYTSESYDLFAHNCNNFTNDFALFLVGKRIPDHITSLPKRVLDTPFGQMLKPQIDASMRSITQAPTHSPRNRSQRSSGASSVGGSAAASASKVANGSPPAKMSPYGHVINVGNLSVLDKHMQSMAEVKTAATLFFTSSTCAPCRIAYPMFDSLAEQNPQAMFIKVDINEARDVASRYQVRATPTFMTFSKGMKQNEWTGADPSLLKANVEGLILRTFPPHPHALLRVPALQFGSLKPVSYAKVPPLDKLSAKLGNENMNDDLTALRNFIEKRSQDPKEAALPDLRGLTRAVQDKILNLPVEVRFAAIDLLRCAMADPRVSGFFAEDQEGSAAMSALVRNVNDLADCPHNLRLITLQLGCNLFSSNLYIRNLMSTNNEMTALLIQLIGSSLLDTSHPTTRVASASLAFNLAAANYRTRREESREGLAESHQVELAAVLVETLSDERNDSAAKALLLALGYLIYCSPQGGELMDLCKALDAKGVIDACEVQGNVVMEVSSLLPS